MLSRNTDLSRIALAFALTVGVIATTGSAQAQSAGSWFSAWSRPQTVALATVEDVKEGGKGPGPLIDQTVRDIVRVTGSGTASRVELSNRYGATYSPNGTTPLTVQAATIAQQADKASIVAKTLRPLTFSGHKDVTIAPGATVISDPVNLGLAAGEDVAVSIDVAFTPLAPSHGAAFVTSYISPELSGDHTRDVTGAAYTQHTVSSLVLTGVDVRSTSLKGAIATTGGSVTDGFGTKSDTFSDYPSWLSLRIRKELPASQQMTVVNNGLGGTTASSQCDEAGTVGPSVEQRVGHDSLALPGVTTLIVYAGTNDLGDGCNAQQIIAAFRSIVAQAHSKGVRVLITTITPRKSYNAKQNSYRAIVNAWVRKGSNCSGGCDYSLDFDKVIRDPQDPNRINPPYDSGDGIHPTGAGYKLIAASIPLAELYG